MQRLKGERGIACAVTKGAGGQRAQAAASGMLPPPGSGPPAAALPQRPSRSGPAACCYADAVGAVISRTDDDGTANLWSWGTTGYQRSADASYGGCWGHRMPGTLVSCKK